MELQYTWNKKSYRRMIEAVARTKGSYLHKAARAVCFFVVLLGGLPFWIALLLVFFENGITPVWLLAYAIILIPLLTVFIALGSFLGVKLQYIRMVSILGRDGIRQIVGTPCTLRLQDDILYKEGPTVGPFASSMTRPAASLRTVRTGSFGLVLVFRDGTSSGVPMSAFNQEQPMPHWEQALKQAMAAPPPVMWATVADGEDTPVGFSCKQGGDPTLIQRCSPARAEAIYRESIRSLMGMRAYWRGYRVVGLLLLLLCAAFLVWMVLKSLFNVLWVVISFGILYRSWRHTVRNVSEKMVGKSVDVFAPDAMVRTNLASGTQGRLAYTEELWLVETPCAISLYQPRYSTLWSFDREVFATPQEEAAFLELLKQRFTAIHSCE